MKFLILLLIATACTRQSKIQNDEYVLIEFASKLEEDYQKLHPEDTGHIRK